MPIFEFKCNNCKKTFELLLKNNKQKAICPDCESENVSKLLSVFATTDTSSVNQKTHCNVDNHSCCQCCKHKNGACG